MVPQALPLNRITEHTNFNGVDNMRDYHDRSDLSFRKLNFSLPPSLTNLFSVTFNNLHLRDDGGSAVLSFPINIAKSILSHEVYAPAPNLEPFLGSANDYVLLETVMFLVSLFYFSFRLVMIIRTFIGHLKIGK